MFVCFRQSQIKPWDVFRIVDKDNENPEDDLCFDICKKITKVVFCGLLFVLVIGGAVVSKSALLFISSHVRRDLELACILDSNREVLGCFRQPLGVNGTILPTTTPQPTMEPTSVDYTDIYTEIYLEEGTTPKPYAVVHGSTRLSLLNDTKYHPHLKAGSTYLTLLSQLLPGLENQISEWPKMTDEIEVIRVELCEEVTIRWVWGLFLCTVTPYICVFLRSIWRVIFKKTKSPNMSTILFVSILR